MTDAQPLLGGRSAAPVQGARSARAAVASSDSFLALASMVAYLWAIHSAKAPIAAACIIIATLALLFHRNPPRFPAPLWLFAGFIAWAAIGYFQAPRPEVVSKALWAYTKIWLIFFVALNVARSRPQWYKFVICWLGVFALYPVRGTLFNIVFGISTMGRYAWNLTFSNPNDLATLTLPMLALALALFQTAPKGWPRRAALAGSLILPAIIFATQSRGGILALATLLLLAFSQHRRRLQAAGLFICIAGVIAVAAPASVWERLAGLKGVTKTDQLLNVDVSADQRYEIWKVARAIVADRPLFGVGVGGYQLAHQQYAQSSQFKITARGRRDTHSTYLHAAAENGIPGLLLLVAVILSVAIPAWRVTAQPGVLPEDVTRIRTMLWGLVAFMQANIFASMEELPFLYLYLGVIYLATELARNQGSPAPARGIRPVPPPLAVRRR